MEPRTAHNLPDDYEEIYYLRLTERSKLIWLNIVGIFLLVFNGIIFFGLLLIYYVLGAPLVIHALPDELPLITGFLIVFAVLPLPEWIHGLAIGYFGHKARYGIKPLMGVLFATADGAYFWRDQYLVVALAPLGIISAGALFMTLLLPGEWAVWLILAAIMNATGAIGDLWMAYVAYRYSPDSLVRDEEDGMRIFTRK